MPAQTSDGMSKPCKACGTQIRKTEFASASKYAKQKFCSVVCSNRSHPVLANGYKQLRQNGKMIRLHRLMMEEKLGRKLGKREHVHHINGDRLDNRLDNLTVMSNAEHASHHHLKYPKIKVCVVCNQPFLTPLKQRRRIKCCSWDCGQKLSMASNATRRLLKQRQKA